MIDQGGHRWPSGAKLLRHFHESVACTIVIFIVGIEFQKPSSARKMLSSKPNSIVFFRTRPTISEFPVKKKHHLNPSEAGYIKLGQECEIRSVLSSTSDCFRSSTREATNDLAPLTCWGIFMTRWLAPSSFYCPDRYRPITQPDNLVSTKNCKQQRILFLGEK